MASPISRWAMARRVTESIISSTSAPSSRKCSAIVVATSAALIRTSAGWSEVATTTTERASAVAEVALDELEQLAAALADQADHVDRRRRRARDHARAGVDLPTPEPAKIPSRWPRPHGHERVERAHAERQPLGRSAGAVHRRRRRARRRPQLGRRRSRGRRRSAGPSPSSTRPSSASPTGTRNEPPVGATGVPGADPAHVAERHQQRAAVAEADHLGGHGRAVAPAGDRAQLAHLGPQAGGLDDEADQIRDAAAVRCAGLPRRSPGRGRPAAAPRSTQASRGSTATGAAPLASASNSADALELRGHAGVDLAGLGAHHAPAAARPAAPRRRPCG